MSKLKFALLELKDERDEYKENLNSCVHLTKEWSDGYIKYSVVVDSLKAEVNKFNVK